MFQKHAKSDFLRSAILQVCGAEENEEFKVLTILKRQAHLLLDADLDGIDATLNSEFENDRAENVYDRILCEEAECRDHTLRTLRIASEGLPYQGLSHLVIAYNASMELRATDNVSHLTKLVEYLLTRNLSREERPSVAIFPCEMEVVSELFQVTPVEFQLLHKDTMDKCAELAKGEDEELRGLNALELFDAFIKERKTAGAWGA